MKKTVAGVGLIVVFVIAFFWARTVSGVLEKGVRMATTEGPSSGFGRNLGNRKEVREEVFRGLKTEEYLEAWEAVPEMRLKKYNRGDLQREILAAWAEVDLKGAVEAALGEAWDDGHGVGGGGIEHHLGFAFGKVIRERPYEVWAMIEGKEFGLFESALMRTVWVSHVGGEELLPAMSTLDRLNLEKALKNQFKGEVKREDLEQIWASLKGQKSMAVSAPELDAWTAKMFSVEEIIALASEGGFVGKHAGAALVLKVADQPASMEKLQLAQALPEEGRGAFIFNVMTQAAGDSEVSKAALDQLLKGEQWTLAATNEAEEAVRNFGARMEPGELAAWAVELPQRKETAKLFHRGVERYIQEDREAAWDWISDFNEGMWRDRAYAEFSQQSLNHFNDPEKSEEALNMISDPNFQREAWSWRRGWENQTGYGKRE